MSKEMVILVVEWDRSTCSCRVGASFGATAHTEAVEIGGPNIPCGKYFTHTAVDEADPKLARDVKKKYPNLPFLGCGEVISRGGKVAFQVHKTPEEIFGI